MDNRVYWGYIVCLKKITHICSQEAKVYCPVGSPHKPKCSSYAGCTSGMLRCLKERFAFQSVVYRAALSASHEVMRKAGSQAYVKPTESKSAFYQTPRWFLWTFKLEKHSSVLTVIMSSPRAVRHTLRFPAGHFRRAGEHMWSSNSQTKWPSHGPGLKVMNMT